MADLAPSTAPSPEAGIPSSQPGNDAQPGGAPPRQPGGGSLGDELLAAAGLADEAAAAEQAEPFELAGIKFESREKAEQNFRTLRGQHRAATQKAQAAERQLAAIQARAAELEAANAKWAEWHRNSQGQARRAGGGQQGQPDHRPARPQGALQRINTEIARREFEERGPDALAQYVAHEVDQQYRADLEAHQQEIAELRQMVAQLQPQLEPLAQAHQEQQRVSAAVDVWKQAAMVAGPDGQSPLLPELFDPQAREVIQRIWSSYPEQVALSPRGVRMAVLEFRDWQASQGLGADRPGVAEQGPREGQGDGGPRRVSRQTALVGSGVPRTAGPGVESEDPVFRQLTAAGPAAGGSSIKWMQRRALS